ncbi:MAG: response regulator transcription factor [Flavobacteriales bacterium]|jgi:two-component system, OmpR family, alkaline phosphatase synthesis response regulator PhoP
MNRICIVEDEESIGELLKMNLEMEDFEVHLFNDGGRAMEELDQLISSDLLILDVMLPEKSGLEICEAVRQKSKVPILILSAKGSTSDRIQGLKLGANDYLAKPFDLEELLLRVNNLLQKLENGGNQILKIGKKEVNLDTFDVVEGDKKVKTLSKREVELLEFFSEKEGQVVSRDEILDRIWGTDSFTTSRTIDNYILSFRKLFELDPKDPKYFHSIRSVGYKFTP